jgi:anti-anti-sigma factor
VPTTDFKIHDGTLAVQQTSERGRVRIALLGELDLANAETAATTLREALHGDKRVVVDLTELEFLDSTGIALLVEAMRDGGPRLSFLQSEHVAVRRLLGLTGLDEQMSFAPAPILTAATPDADVASLLSAA